MSRSGKDFEDKVAEAFFKSLGEDFKEIPHKTYKRKKYKGRSGNSYEIDLSIELTIQGMNMIIVIECKQHKRKIGSDVVRQFLSLIDDIKANKGLIVSEQGFQRGAIKLANHHSIALATFNNYIYTPFIGDPELINIYKKRIYEYVGDQKVNNFQVSLPVALGNAYRAERILVHNSQPDHLNQYSTSSDGFLLISPSEELQIDTTDLISILLLKF